MKNLFYAVGIPVIFVLLWSTGFTVSKLGLGFAEPLGFLSMRFAIAAVLLVLLMLLFRKLRPRRITAIEAAHSAVVGILLQAVYLGGVFSSISLGIGAGLSALIVGLQPLLTVVLAALWLSESLSRRKLAGILLGLAGVVVVIGERGNLDGTLSTAGIFLSVAALLGITFGTLYQKRYCTEIPVIAGLTAQFSASSLVLLPLAYRFESLRFDWQWTFIGALAWLVIVLSLGAVFLLMWLIRRGEAGRVATLFYLVPPVVAIQALYLFDEKLSTWLVAGTAMCIAGVAMVLTGKSRHPK